ncbi:MAG: S-layer homology domain-containing protein, partial [Peptococcaceae bacterium]|nr:S-layer homology domain-containing protein [Peptococcaceae bacterium]
IVRQVAGATGTITGDGTLAGTGTVSGSGTVSVKDNQFAKDSSLTLSAKPSTVTAGDEVTLTAELSSTDGSVNDKPITFSVNGKEIGKATTDDGTATLETTASTSDWQYGDNTVTATFAGDMNLAASTGTATVTMDKLTPKISVSGQATGPTTVELDAATLDPAVANGKVEYAVNTTNTAPTDGWQEGTTFSGLTANTTYYFFARVTGSNDYADATSAGVAITTLPEITTTTLDDGTVGVAYEATLEANPAENVTWTISKGTLPDDLNLEGDKISGTPTKAGDYTFTVQVTTNGGVSATQELNLTIGKGTQAAPDAPTAESVSANSVTLKEIKGAEYGYTTGNEQSVPEDRWQSSTTFDKLEAGTTYTFYARYAGNNDYEVSPASKGTAITTLPEIITTTLDDGTVGVEYKATLEADSGENVTWTISKGSLPDGLMLNENTGVIFGTPKKAVTNHIFTVQAIAHGGARVTKELQLTIGKGAQNAPAAPTAESVSANSVTLQEIAGAEYGYTTGNEQSVPEDRWQSSTTFDKLEAGTTYTFYARLAKNDDYDASPASTGIAIATAPEASAVGINYAAETLSFAESLEVNTAEDFSDTAIGSGDSITTYIGKTLYVRVKATDKVPASAAVAVRIPARPDAPKLRVSNESIDGKHDGQITGVTAAMEYQKQGDTSWTACDGETITDLAPGTYEVRLKATENDFAGTPATVEIKTGAERTYTLNVTAPTFDSVTTGYAQPEAKAIAITSTGNSDATIDSVAVDSSDFAIAEGDKSVTAGGTNESWTIHPAADLAAGTYTATVTVTYDAGATATTAVSFTVNRPSSGGGGTITPPTYPPTVTEPDNGSVTTSPARPKQGETVTITPDPDEGYEVDNITVTDKNGKTIDVEKNTDGTYSFIQPSGKVTITVIYREAGEEPEPSALPFTDVSEGAWYIDPVRFVYSEGLMTGTSATTFSPNLTTTRGMIVAILYRMEGEPDLSGENLGVPFADVDANAYYSDAVYWARMNGIVSGYSSESFGPTDSITREQLAAILYNVAAYKGVDTSARNDLSAYTDSGHLSGWATDAMQWANAAGIANGMSATELAPKGNATRAQVAAMLQRYITNVIS